MIYDFIASFKNGFKKNAQFLNKVPVVLRNLKT